MSIGNPFIEHDLSSLTPHLGNLAHESEYRRIKRNMEVRKTASALIGVTLLGGAALAASTACYISQSTEAQKYILGLIS
jgi:hypothetical protein